MLEVMIGVALAIAPAWTPGPDDPVCEPGQVVEVDHCSQGQLPEERIGRAIDPYETSPEPATPPGPAPATPTELASTGVAKRPYAAAATAAIVVGAGMVVASRRGQAHGR